MAQVVRRCPAIMAWCIFLLMTIQSLAEEPDGRACEPDHQAAVTPGLARCNLTLSPRVGSSSTVNTVLECRGGKCVASVEEEAEYILRLFCPSYARAEISGGPEFSARISKYSPSGLCFEREGNLISFNTTAGMKPTVVCDSSPQGECVEIEWIVRGQSAQKSELVQTQQSLHQFSETQVNRMAELEKFRTTRRWFELGFGGEWSIDHFASEREKARKGWTLSGSALADILPEREERKLYLSIGGTIREADRFEAVRLVPNLHPQNLWVEEKSRYLGATLGVVWEINSYFLIKPQLTLGQMNFFDSQVTASQERDLQVILSPAKTETVLAGGASVEAQFLLGGQAGLFVGPTFLRNFEGIQNYRGAQESPAVKNYRSDWGASLGLIISPRIGRERR